MIMPFIPAQIPQEISDEALLTFCDRLKSMGTIWRDQSTLGHGTIGMRKQAFEPHLLKPSHDLLKTFLTQLGGTFNAGDTLEDLPVGFLVKVEILPGNVDESFFPPANLHLLPPVEL
jgi:hypothetical protein